MKNLFTKKVITPIVMEDISFDILNHNFALKLNVLWAVRSMNKFALKNEDMPSTNAYFG